jgi:hypothetical protein
VTGDQAARCLVRGCPVRFAYGGDRLCRGHQDDGGPTMEARLAAYDLMLTTAPGGDGDGDHPA